MKKHLRISLLGFCCAVTLGPIGVAAAPFTNVRTRAEVGVGHKVLVNEFVITGTQPKRIIVRALGPTGGFTLADPTLELRDATGAILLTNDDWKIRPDGTSQQTEIETTGRAPGNDKEAAIVATLAPGSYSAIMRGAGGSVGTGANEFYDLDSQSSSSVQAFGSRADLMASGDIPFLTTPIFLTEQRSVVVRVLGPSLAQGSKAITGAVQDPHVRLINSSGTQLAESDNWQTSGNVGGTALEPSHDTEAAFKVDLAPGSYTAIADGNGEDGIVFLQLYALPYNTPLDPAPVTGEGSNPGATTCVTPPSGLGLWLTGDGDTTDLLEGNTGQIHGNANAEAPGKVGTGFGMDGNGDYVEVFNEAAIRPNHLTIDAWVKFDSLDSTRVNAPAGHQYIITKHNSRQNGSGFEEGYALVKVRQGGKDVFNFVLTTANTTRTGIVSTTAIQPGQFYHVAGTFDGQTARLYVNGVLEASAPANFTLDYSSRSLYLGSSGIAGFDAFFNGVLDEVQIYNRALSNSEIAALSNAGSFGVCKVRPGLWEAGRDLVINETPDNPGETNAHNSIVPEWSYGYRSFAAGTAFTLFTPDQRFNNGGLPNLQGFGVVGVPLVTVNVGDQPIFQNNVRPIYPGQMVLHPSTSNAFAVVRWTAPAAGSYRVLAEWLDLDPNGGNGASAHVVLNGTEIFGNIVGPDAVGPARFVGLEWGDGGGAELSAVDLKLNAGDVLDFAVGSRGEASFDTTTFNAVVRRVPGVQITNAPPAGRTEEGIQVPEGSDITLEAQVDSEQPIDSVILLVNGTDGPIDRTAPYSLTQTNLAPGVTYYFSVKATDIHGVESSSEQIKVVSVKNSSAAAAENKGAKGNSPKGAAVTGFSYTCKQSGAWQNPATWGTANVPGRNDDATIPPGFSVIDNGYVDIDNLSVGGTLVIGSPESPRSVTVYGTLEVHGEIRGGDPSSLLAGFGRSNFVAGPATFNNLIVALSGPAVVTGKGEIGGSNSNLVVGGDMNVFSPPGTNRPTIVGAEKIEIKGRLAPDLFGRIIAPGGVIARDGASVIGMNGASAISENGAGVVGGNGASVIGMNGANVIGPNGASLISERGGGLISNKGGGVPNLHSSRTDGATAPALDGPGVILERATLGGRLQVIGNLTNQSGFVSPGNSAGKITVSGNYTQEGAGTLLLEIGGTQTDQFDQLEISGTANLAGNLVVKTINGYTPAAGDTTSPLVYSSVNGNFDQVTSNAQISFGPGGAQVNVSGPNPPAPKALNIATRMKVETGDNALIAGFIITGSQPKKVIIRGIGPSLPFPGVLADPTLNLDNGAVTNDNWRSNQEQEIIDTTIPPSNNLESAIVATLNPGQHTAILRGSGNATGIGVVEVYDLDSGSPVQLANISSRGFVQAGDDVMIGGFIIAGTYPAKVIVRAIGPSLTFSGKLEDPTLELVNENGGRISNDNWRETQETEIFLTTIPPTNDKEAAIVATLAPGNYTAIVRGKDGTTGIAVVEAYNLQ